MHVIGRNYKGLVVLVWVAAGCSRCPLAPSVSNTSNATLTIWSLNDTLLLSIISRQMSSAASKTKFLAVWPQIRDELVAYLQKENMPQDAQDWFKAVSLARPGYCILDTHHQCSSRV